MRRRCRTASRRPARRHKLRRRVRCGSPRSCQRVRGSGYARSARRQFPQCAMAAHRRARPSRSARLHRRPAIRIAAAHNSVARFTAGPRAEVTLPHSSGSCANQRRHERWQQRRMLRWAAFHRVAVLDTEKACDFRQGAGFVAHQRRYEREWRSRHNRAARTPRMPELPHRIAARGELAAAFEHGCSDVLVGGAA